MKISKSRDSQKAQTKKTTYMSDKTFVGLQQALEDALAFERGDRRDLSVRRFPGPAVKSVTSRHPTKA
jgi:hypothetical protein